MLTLVKRRTSTIQISWDKLPRFRRYARGLVGAWRSRAHQRQSLAQLNDHLLADIGLTREAQIVECSKPFWCP